MTAELHDIIRDVWTNEHVLRGLPRDSEVSFSGPRVTLRSGDLITTLDLNGRTLKLSDHVCTWVDGAIADLRFRHAAGIATRIAQAGYRGWPHAVWDS